MCATCAKQVDVMQLLNWAPKFKNDSCIPNRCIALDIVRSKLTSMDHDNSNCLFDDNFQSLVGESAGVIFRYGHRPKLKKMSFSTSWEYFSAFKNLICMNWIGCIFNRLYIHIGKDSKEHSFCKSSYEVHLRMTNASNDPNSFSAREAIQF